MEPPRKTRSQCCDEMLASRSARNFNPSDQLRVVSAAVWNYTRVLQLALEHWLQALPEDGLAVSDCEHRLCGDPHERGRRHTAQAAGNVYRRR